MTMQEGSKWWSELPWTRLVAAGILLISLAVTYGNLSGPPCLWKTMLHVPCPGCGLTRSIRALWHGNLLLSFRYHPLGIPLIVGCMVSLLTWPASRHQPVTPWLSRWGWPVVLTVMLGIWLLRLTLAWSGSTFFEW